MTSYKQQKVTPLQSHKRVVHEPEPTREKRRKQSKNVSLSLELELHQALHILSGRLIAEQGASGPLLSDLVNELFALFIDEMTEGESDKAVSLQVEDWINRSITRRAIFNARKGNRTKKEQKDAPLVKAQTFSLSTSTYDLFLQRLGQLRLHYANESPLATDILNVGLRGMFADLESGDIEKIERAQCWLDRATDRRERMRSRKHLCRE